MTADTALLRAIRIPIGSPITMQKITASNVMISVSMLSSHSPKTPKTNMDSVTRIVDLSPATTYVTQAARAMTPTHPSSGTGRGKCRDADQLLQELDERVEEVADGAQDAAEEPVVLPFELHPVAGLVELLVERGRVLEPKGLGVLALQDGVQDQPDAQDAQELPAGVTLAPELDVRLLLLGRRTLRRRRRTRGWQGGRGHDASSSATTTRRMSSSSTTPTSLSPSTTRHGPWWSRTTRAASRTIWLDWRIGPSVTSPLGSRMTHFSVSTCDLGTSLVKSRT